MPSEIKPLESEQKTSSEIKPLTARRKRKSLRLEIPLNLSKRLSKTEKVILPSTPQKICPTPDLESYMPTGGNGSFSPYTDSYGDTFFKFQGVVVKSRINSLVSGAQGTVNPVIAITPQNTRSYPLVKKAGGELVRREVELLRVINKNRNAAFPFNLIQKILCWEEGVLTTNYYSRHEKGGDLQKHQTYIQEQYKLKNDMALSYLFNIMSQLLEALDALHNTQFQDNKGKYHLGIVHNDLKPANIFVRENGHVVVADFGCAYFADETAPQFGTVIFSDPQLFYSKAFCKEPLESATKSDIWSLGLIFELLSRGSLPAKKTGLGYVLPNGLPDIEMQLKFQDWAKTYEASYHCKKTREAKNYLEKLELNVSIPVDITIQAEILKNLALVMQLPVAERPTSRELKERLDKLVPYFGTREACEEKSKIFASKLIENIAKSKTIETETVALENTFMSLSK